MKRNQLEVGAVHYVTLRNGIAHSVLTGANRCGSWSSSRRRGLPIFVARKAPVCIGGNRCLSLF